MQVKVTFKEANVGKMIRFAGTLTPSGRLAKVRVTGSLKPASRVIVMANAKVPRLEHLQQKGFAA